MLSETNLTAQLEESQMPVVNKKVQVLFRFSHQGAEVFSVDAAPAQIPLENWTGKMKILFECDALLVNCDADLIWERTRTTDGVSSIFYYVKVTDEFPKNCNVATLEIDME
jgi:hypothetical protein